MAFSAPTARGLTPNKVSGTTVSHSPTNAIAAGKIAIAECVSDNLQTTDGPSTDHAVTDSQGGTWTKIFEHTVGAGAAGSGVTLSRWFKKVTTQMETTDTVTLTISSAVTAKVIGLIEVTVGAGNTVQVDDYAVTINGADGSATTLSGLASLEHFWLNCWGAEGVGNPSASADADYTFMQAAGTSGGAGASNIRQSLSVRIFTGTTDTATRDGSSSTDEIQVLAAISEVSGGTTFTQSMAGSITPTGTVGRKTKLARTGSSTPTGTLIKKTAKTLGGSSTGTGALTKKTGKTLGGTTTGTGALTTHLIQRRTLAGNITTAGTLTRQIFKALAGNITTVGVAANKTRRTLAGSTTATGTVATRRFIGQALAGTITTVGAITQKTRKTLTGQTVATGTLANKTRKTLAGASTPTGALTLARSFARTLAGSTTATGSLTRKTRKALAATLTGTGALTRKTSKGLAGSATATGGLDRKTRKTLTGSVTPAGVLTVLKIVGAAVQAISRTIARIRSGRNIQSPRTGRTIPGGDTTRKV